MVVSAMHRPAAGRPCWHTCGRWWGVNEGRTAGGEKGVLKEQATSEGLCLSTACIVAHST